MRRPNRNFNIPFPTRQTPGIRTFEDWIVKFPPPRPKMVLKYLILSPDFVCEMPLLKNNRRRFVSSVIKFVYIPGTQRHQFKMERRCLRDTRYALRTRNTYQLVSQLRRMLFEWRGILQFISQSGFSFDIAFFFFHSSLLCYGYSKNLCRHKRGTKP